MNNEYMMEPQYVCMTCKTVIGPLWDDFENKCDCDTYDYEVWRMVPLNYESRNRDWIIANAIYTKLFD